MKPLVDSLRSRRWSHLAVANLRILLGFAFLPAGLKKVLYQPFTDAGNTGPFHEFLHAFYATGAFYVFVGTVQLLVAVLLMTQVFASLGAALALPVITAITAFCWSTGVVPTAIVTTLMLCAVLALLAWDLDLWLPILRPGHPATPAAGTRTAEASSPRGELIDRSLWRACGTGILVFYGLACIAYGGVYRPRGVDLDHPAFYVLVVIALCPVVTLLVEIRRRDRSARSG